MSACFLTLLKAQGNLVPNFSFENYLIPGSASMYNAPPWGSLGTADLFNSSNGPCCATPQNICGYQIPYSGSAYAGVLTYADGQPDIREYIQIPLIQPLDSGVSYCVSFYVTPAGGLRYSSDRIAAYFSVDSNVVCSGCLLSVVPQVQNEVGNLIGDTSNWVMISGVFLATDTMRYLTIGNFYPDDSTSRIIINAAGPSGWGVYFYIDAVSVFKLISSNAGTDVNTCLNDSTQIGDLADPMLTYSWVPGNDLSDSTVSNPWAMPQVTTTYFLTISDTGNFYCTGNLVDSVTITVNDCTPVPPLNVPTLFSGNEVFYVTSLPANSTLKIFDTRGRLVLNEVNYQNDFSVMELDAALYVYEIQLPDLTVLTGKFIIVR